MGPRKPVASRARRLWRDLPKADRGRLRAMFRTLEARFGLRDRLAAEYARLATEAWGTASQASEAALAEGAKRRHGRGRRPSLQALDRRQKRQALSVGSFDQLVRRLHELAQRTGPGPDLAAALRRAPILEAAQTPNGGATLLDRLRLVPPTEEPAP
jgi:hypothetical protein